MKKYGMMIICVSLLVVGASEMAWGFSIPAGPQNFYETPVSNTLLVIFAEESDIFGEPGQPGPVEPNPGPGIPGGPGDPGLPPQTPAAVPEPGTIVLFGMGLLGMAFWLRRKKG